MTYYTGRIPYWLSTTVANINHSGDYDVDKMLYDFKVHIDIEMNKGKSVIHDVLMDRAEDTHVLYLAEVGAPLSDGRVLLKYGETTDIFNEEDKLRNVHEDVYFTKIYTCNQPIEYVKWLNCQPIFEKYKYVNDHHNDMLAVTPIEYNEVTIFVNTHCGKETY